MMNTRFAALAVALALSPGAAAMAQTFAGPAFPGPVYVAPSSIAASMVGKWLRDPQGNIVGSVRSLSGDGQTAEIMVGSYFQNGSHVATVPSSALSVVDGRVVLRTDTALALNTPRR